MEIDENDLLQEKQKHRDFLRETQKKQEEYYNPKPAWSPANNTIPFGRN